MIVASNFAIVWVCYYPVHPSLEGIVLLEDLQCNYRSLNFLPVDDVFDSSENASEPWRIQADLCRDVRRGARGVSNSYGLVRHEESGRIEVYAMNIIRPDRRKVWIRSVAELRFAHSTRPKIKCGMEWEAINMKQRVILMCRLVQTSHPQVYHSW